MKSGLLVLIPLAVWGGGPHDVRAYGAKGDGVAKDTAAVQAAIDAAAKEGGGVVLLSPGKYLCGTLRLKSQITLEISAGARLVASPDRVDFDAYEELPFPRVDDEETSYFRYALLSGEGVEHVSIQGRGVIDGNRPKRGGPKTVAFKNSSFLSIRGVSIHNAPNYAVSLLGCENVDVDGVQIINGYSDGIDPDCSRFVRISNCYVDAYDDAICLKSSQALGRPRMTEHITVTNSVLRTNCNHLKMGTESRGGFRNIAISNCTLLGRDRGRPAISGIAVESVDGAEIEGIIVTGITMRDAGAPLFIRLGNRGRGMSVPVPGYVRNISISNVVAVGATTASSITGLAGHPVRSVTLSDLDLTMAGGGAVVATDVPEAPEKYPEATMFGALPGHSLYARHVEGLTLRNVKTRWLKPDARPAAVFDDVRGLELIAFRSTAPPAPQPLLWFRDVAGALVTGSLFLAEVPLLLRVSGAGNRDLNVLGNDLRLVRKILDVQRGADRSAVALTGNVTAGRIPGID
jgi:hypothetical protein